MSAAAPPNVTGLLLSAGASSRMGAPKALLDFGGRTALARLAETLRAAGIADLVAVVPPDAAIAAEAERCGVRVVKNPLAHLGRTGSLQFGLRETPPGRSVVFAPVDAPLVSASTVRAVLEASGRAAIVRPVHGGRGGHPVFLASHLRAEILHLAPDASLRDLIHRDPSRRLDLPVDDPEVLANINTPEDYGAAIARLGDSPQSPSARAETKDASKGEPRS